MRQNSIRTIPNELLLPTAAIGRILEHSTMLPIVSQSGIFIVDGEVRILQRTTDRERTLVGISDTSTVKMIRDDQFRLGTNQIASLSQVNQTFFQEDIFPIANSAGTRRLKEIGEASCRT